MKIANTNEEICVVKEGTKMLSLIREIADYSNAEKAFIVCNIGQIVKKYDEWMSIMPRVTPFYAVKCNNDHRILKTLAALGTGFDCSSQREIETILEFGLTTDNIIFAHTTKLISYIQYAASVGVSKMTFDNEQELHKIKKYYPNSELVLRFRCDDLSADAVLGTKFGCDPETEAPELLKLARSLSLNVIGICFHIGSGCHNPDIYRTAFNYSRQLFDFGQTIGYDFNFLDIGGGYPGNTGTTLDAFGKIINEEIEKYFSDKSVRIIAEPGMYFVAASATLASNIHSMKTIKETDDSGNVSVHNMYYLNDGFYGSFNMFNTHNSDSFVEPLTKSKSTTLLKSSLWGPTCDSKDKIFDLKMLPQLNTGDWLLFHDMGHYTFEAGSEFNGFFGPDLYFFIDRTTWNLLKNKKPFTRDDFIVEPYL